MNVVEVKGSFRQMGRQMGEAFREAIRWRLATFGQDGGSQEHAERLPTWVACMRQTLPDMLEQMEGVAEGAGLTFEEAARLDLPGYRGELDVDDGCTNIGFAGGPDGPIWGKNNDGKHAEREKQQPVCCIVHRPDRSIPAISFAFAGSIGFGDAMNAEGLAAGHSSVGSVFQQSDTHPTVRLWAHQGMLTCRTTGEFARHMASRPTRGKGFSWVVVDRAGTAVSLEVACPITQVRRSARPDGHVHCVNVYQLPHLANADRRKPDYKAHSLLRWKTLDKKLEEGGDFGLDHMKRLLRFHGPSGICRHSGPELSHTEYSMIGLPASGRVLFYHGHPCEGEYSEVRF